MRITLLPPATNPQAEQTKRQHSPHSPRQVGYRKYTPCLRWDFAFSCAICLIHECDAVSHGVQGSRVFWIEHFVPQHKDSNLRNRYSNCFYSCQYCNHSRGKKALSEGRLRLLNPCEVPWGDHFQVENDKLKALTPDGRFTEERYKFNAADSELPTANCEQRTGVEASGFRKIVDS